MIAIILVLILLAILGTPLFAIMGAGGLVASYSADLDPVGLIIEIYRLASQPNLIAIPLFTFAGITLAAGDGTKRLIKLFNALLGWMPGGLAIVTIVSCSAFTAFTGASGVTIIALGALLYPMLEHAHYRHKFCLGLLTTSGSLGLLFPPSMAILLYGIVSGVSIDELFVAGMIPGLVLLVMLSIYSIYSAPKFDIPTQDFSMRETLKAIRECIWDILLPIFIFTGIFGGFVTITEVAALTAAYVLFVETVISKKINLIKDLPHILIDTTTLVGSILIILGMAMGLTNLLIDSQLPMQLLEFVEQFVSSPLQFLLLLNLFLLVVGAMMDIFSAIVVVVPLIMPLALRYNIDPVHLGIIFLANLEIGYMTPPVGINLFIASQRFKQPILKLFQATFPFLLIMLVWLLLITYVPFLTTWWQ
ncbi:TRAP transporter large permease [sulfur-oxidizing endosymbiont of Gigantopelta aegis]|uniref:TRAP transporter large permease n=1 Tax=sulfur-oxidizing endosymbiont of Gigantopelta aegis TaxID=2794934 RepID=UPI0018DC4452|nr:TRAP transporter large permease subunit [sulfur-oxidizing endosymbiont of Gigantopelta aegis]